MSGGKHKKIKHDKKHYKGGYAMIKIGDDKTPPTPVLARAK